MILRFCSRINLLCLSFCCLCVNMYAPFYFLLVSLSTCHLYGQSQFLSFGYCVSDSACLNRCYKPYTLSLFVLLFLCVCFFSSVTVFYVCLFFFSVCYFWYLLCNCQIYLIVCFLCKSFISLKMDVYIIILFSILLPQYFKRSLTYRLTLNLHFWTLLDWSITLPPPPLPLWQSSLFRIKVITVLQKS